MKLRTIFQKIASLIGNERGQIPSTLTDQFGALLTTTLRNIQGRMQDNISRSNKLVAYLMETGRKKTVNGGERIQIPLMHALNTTADIYSGYGTIDTTPQDGMTSAFYTWSQMATAITISRLERRQNSGDSQAINLLQAKTEQAEASAKELLNNCIVAGRITVSADLGQFLPRIGRLDSNASGPQPLAALVDANPSRSAAIGNINPNTYAFWRNQATDSAATTFAGLKQEMSQVYNDASKGIGGAPNFLLGDQRAWEQYYNSLQNQERFVDPKMLDILGGSDNLKFRGGTFMWDEVVPDVKTNAEVVDAIGTVSLSTIYFLNTNFWWYVVDSETDFITTPFVTPTDQDATTAHILWMGATAVSNRRKQGVLMGIARNIVS